MTVKLKQHKTNTKTPNTTEILQYAENAIRKKGGRFTRIRKYIYKTLLDAPHPLGAYEIIGYLDGIGAQKPPTVYRALAWLIDAGLVARIAYNSRYTAVPIGLKPNSVAFLICEACGSTDTVEAKKVTGSLRQTAKNRGFTERNMVVEIIGLCSDHENKETS